MKLQLNIAVLLFVLTGTVISMRGQEPASPPMPAYQPLSDAQLDQLLGPIALYPDPLIAKILPASTLPTQIVLADRYIGGGGDPNQIDQQPWDPSVQAVARYPTVLKWMDDNLSETTELGQAFLNQPSDVMSSIQRLRATADQLGNLQTTPQQQVTVDDNNIEIDPTAPDELYVPVYQPDQVYDSRADGPPFITFGTGCPIGDWLDSDCDWGSGEIIVWNSGDPRPANWWHESPALRSRGEMRVWRSGNHLDGEVTNHVDRGWNNAPTPAMTRQEQARQAPPQGGYFNSVPRVESTPVEHDEPISRSEANGALIGIQSSRDTRAYSDRGQQSMQEMTRSTPSFRAESSGGGGHAGGGGGHR
jgi:Protein of unknown function (DUF3300)